MSGAFIYPVSAGDRYKKRHPDGLTCRSVNYHLQATYMVKNDVLSKLWLGNTFQRPILPGMRSLV